MVFLLVTYLSLVAVAFVVLFLPPLVPLVFARSNEDDFVEPLDVEFSFLDFKVVELSFFTTTSVSVRVVALVLASLVWFLEELRLLDLMVLVWFLEERLVVGLINLVWFLVDFFFRGCSNSSFSESNSNNNILLLLLLLPSPDKALLSG